MKMLIRNPILVAAFASLLLVAPPATSTAAIWGGGTDGNWTNAANWVGGTLPAVGENAYFINFPGILNRTIDLGVNQSIGSLTFDGADPYSLINNKLTLGGDVTQSGSAAISIFAGLDTGGSARIFGGKGLGPVTISGVLSGAGGVTIAAGNYIFSNPTNSFTGGLTVSGGQLTLTGPGNLSLSTASNTPSLMGAGPLTINGGELRLLPGTPTNTVGNIGTTTAATIRTVTFGANGGALTYAGIPGNGAALNLNVLSPSGTPAIIREGSPNPTTGSGGWQANPAINLNSFTGGGVARFEMTNGAYLRMNYNTNGVTWINGTVIFSGQPGGDVSVSQTNTTVGRLGFNSGTTNIITGGLFFENYNQVSIEGGSAATNAFAGGRILDADITINNGVTAFAGRGTGTAGTNQHFLSLGMPNNANNRTLRVKDTATAQMDLALRNDQPTAGGIYVNMPTVLEAGGTLRFAQTITARNDGTAQSYSKIIVNNTITGQGTTAKDSVVDLLLGAPQGLGLSNGVLFASAANLVVNGSGLGGLRVQGPGAFVNNLLTPARLQALSGSGGTLTVAYSDNSSGIFSAGPTLGSSVKLGFDKQGAGTPTYTLGAAANDLATWGGVVVKGGTVNVGANQVFNGNGITPTTLDVTGGKLSLNGGNLTFSGAATVAGGSLAIASGKLLTVGNLTLDPTAVLDLELDTAGVVGGNLVQVNGNFVLDGTLSVTGLSHFGAGTYQLFNYTGTLTDNGLALGSMPAGFDYLVQSASGNVNLLVSAIPEPGTLGLLGMGLGLALWARRSRRS